MESNVEKARSSLPLNAFRGKAHLLQDQDNQMDQTYPVYEEIKLDAIKFQESNLNPSMVENKNNAVMPSSKVNEITENAAESTYRPRYSSSRGGAPKYRMNMVEQKIRFAQQASLVDPSSSSPPPLFGKPPSPRAERDGKRKRVNRSMHERANSAGLDILSAAAVCDVSSEDLALAAGAVKKKETTKPSHRSLSSLDLQMNVINDFDKRNVEACRATPPPPPLEEKKEALGIPDKRQMFNSYGHVPPHPPLFYPPNAYGQGHYYHMKEPTRPHLYVSHPPYYYNMNSPPVATKHATNNTSFSSEREALNANHHRRISSFSSAIQKALCHEIMPPLQRHPLHKPPPPHAIPPPMMLGNFSSSQPIPLTSPEAVGGGTVHSGDDVAVDAGNLHRNKRLRRKCSIPNCLNRVVQGGLCIQHGAKRKICKIEGCTKHVKKLGLCSSHGPARKRCEAENCEKVAVQGGRCIAHGAKKKLCVYPDCTKQAILSGHCKKHYDLVHNITHVGNQKVVAAPKTTFDEEPPKLEATARTKGKPGHKRGLSIFSEMKAVNTIINEWQ